MGHNSEREIIKLFEDGDRALMNADVPELERVYADDYLQSDDAGRFSTRADLIRNLTMGSIRFLSMKSTGRRLRLFGDFAIVHGSEEDEIEKGGKRYAAKYVYTDLVVRRNERWQIVSSQLARLE